ncbi:nucleic-acid-binding protein from mobile element jockey [Lasius niger]|uniref:Nucleic-acid-binding protein from mobile element jockey n=1 Tax=Lasius niger TaxID=67767 RepID=A0A0J7K9N5_LASNI|nr:nucleic-acid-binding protein from mobile element jockey [Lasius niger]
MEMQSIKIETDYMGYKTLRCKLVPNKDCDKKGKNYVKIMMALHKIRCFPDVLVMDQFNLASLKFKEITEANLCIEKINKELQDILKVYIDRCTITSKGVITDWPFNIQELWEALESRDDIVQLEKMKRKVYNPEKKESLFKETDNIIIMMKGNRLATKLKIYEGMGYLKVRPYIETVKQCYNCFRFGHMKTVCKREAKCPVCGAEAHGLCNEPLKCCNCDGSHRSTYKGCSVYQRNRDIKVIMAYDNVSYHDAVRMITDQEETSEVRYDRYEARMRSPRLPVSYADIGKQPFKVSGEVTPEKRREEVK